MGTRQLITAMAFIAASGVVPSIALTAPSDFRDTVSIHDAGGVPLKEFYTNERTREKKPRPQPQTLEGGILAPQLYPVVTRKMRPGRLSMDEANNIQTHVLLGPFFIVGDDEVSRRWLAQNADELVARTAVGIVVNVESPDVMQELLDIADNRLIMQPMPGDDLAQSLNLHHYPVYISPEGVHR